MPLSAGDKLGHYEVLSLLGVGGMGEVWQAHDPRLKRDVAIKVSAAQFSERFEREAQAIAALAAVAQWCPPLRKGQRSSERGRIVLRRRTGARL